MRLALHGAKLQLVLHDVKLMQLLPIFVILIEQTQLPYFILVFIIIQ